MDLGSLSGLFKCCSALIKPQGCWVNLSSWYLPCNVTSLFLSFEFDCLLIDLFSLSPGPRLCQLWLLALSPDWSTEGEQIWRPLWLQSQMEVSDLRPERLSQGHRCALCVTLPGGWAGCHEHSYQLWNKEQPGITLPMHEMHHNVIVLLSYPLTVNKRDHSLMPWSWCGVVLVTQEFVCVHASLYYTWLFILISEFDGVLHRFMD